MLQHMSQTSLPQMALFKRKFKLVLELVLFALLVAVLERRYLATSDRSSKDNKGSMEDESALLPMGPLPFPVPTVSPLLPPDTRTITVKAIGHGPNSWFYGALKGTFDMCYRNQFLDPSKKCKYLDDSESHTKSDVVVFRGTQLDNPKSQLIINGTEGKRPENQWWVFFDNEPPYKVWKYSNLSNYKGVFNLTATFAPDSDIPRVDMRRFKQCVRNPETYKSLESVDYTKKKRRGASVAWLASECVTQSKREDYVKELQKYIQVDIYGVCGPLQCGSRSLGTWAKDKCHERLLHRNNSYKFYLSFENSFCKDYVTEKFWILEKMDIVPIVMGAVDYGNMMPKDSFIDVRDFASPKELARYLQYLGNHKHAYNRYIRNKNSLDCYLTYTHMPWECKLCEFMHSVGNRKKIVYDLGSFWGSKRCMTPEQYFRRMPDNVFN